MEKFMLIDNTYEKREKSFALIYGKYCLWFTVRNPFRYVNFGIDIHFKRPTVIINVWMFEIKFYKDKFYI